MNLFHFERALFVVGEPDAGKSTQIRNMFLDVRLHRNGEVPSSELHKLPEAIRISNERYLYMRLTSPHEAGESLAGFLRKTKDRLNKWSQFGPRANFVCPLQPNAAKKMPSATDTVAAFVKRFSPERTRVVFLTPDRHGTTYKKSWLKAETDKLWKCSAEVICLDARSRSGSGLILADYFDFT